MRREARRHPIDVHALDRHKSKLKNPPVRPPLIPVCETVDRRRRLPPYKYIGLLANVEWGFSAKIDLLTLN